MTMVAHDKCEKSRCTINVRDGTLDKCETNVHDKCEHFIPITSLPWNRSRVRKIAIFQTPPDCSKNFLPTRDDREFKEQTFLFAMTPDNCAYDFLSPCSFTLNPKRPS